MPGLDLVDHSPHHPSPAAPLANSSNLVLIDNYDSFTWNVYQYLVLEGATVTVFRNDKITLDELIARQPTQLVISPGPGHPDRDSGVSREAIRHFAGKIPVLGVCMGEQCILSVFGGQVVSAGEILHGKTSDLRHDSKGIYQDLAQDLPVTRYHSLAGTHPSLPSCLEVSSWISRPLDGEKGLIMGVRHKEFVVEGVQFHPESILTEGGRAMLKNFLKMRGGSWVENERLKGTVEVAPESIANGGQMKSAKDAKVSILERIYAHRRAAVEAQKKIPSQRLADLQASYDLDLAPPLIAFLVRVRQSPFSISLMAEIKRASPSKGVISLSTSAPKQARTYALAGASVISVLTEPEWFKGSIEDLRAARQALEGMPNRPAVLRKDFIFDEYQILEARLGGADTVLLIVKMLDEDTLTRLYRYSLSLHMEPLVEVNTVEEMKIAIELGSKVIGVNNRNLTSFEVDLGTTRRLMDLVPEGTVVCALSGISGPADVQEYKQSGIGAVLVGEALMRAPDTTAFVEQLLGEPMAAGVPTHSEELLVKICGTRTPEAAKAAIDAGADLIGMVLVEGRRRYVGWDKALQISKVVHETNRTRGRRTKSLGRPAVKASSYFQHASSFLSHPSRALLVGVFQDQPLPYVLGQRRILNLDIVQFHGSEPLEWAALIPVPVIRSFKPGDPGISTRGYHAMSLLDTAGGGSGQALDAKDVVGTLRRDEGLRVILAGGLNAENVRQTMQDLGDMGSRVVAVDVSSGVEDEGRHSLDKIQSFVAAAKGRTKE
ncbi:MAG: bifunctional tryptophan synthase trp1 [Thelocarpon impressellum]|nr:MAG: bifunctional tryptophan synthase trp1 [Thelocarpon impressellum]